MRLRTLASKEGKYSLQKVKGYENPSGGKYYSHAVLSFVHNDKHKYLFNENNIVTTLPHPLYNANVDTYSPNCVLFRKGNLKKSVKS